MSAPTLTRARSLVANFFSLIAAQVVSKLTTLVALFLLARYLGQEDFGRYSVALAIPLSLDALGDLGVSQVLVRDGAGRPAAARRNFADALPAKLALGVLTVALSYALARLIGLPGEVVEAATYLAVAKALDSLTLLARSVFEAFERMEYEAASLVLDAGVRLGFVVYALLSGFGLVGLAKALAIGALVVLLATAFVVVHRFLPRLDWRPALARIPPLVSAGVPFALAWFFEALGLRVGVVLAGQIGGDAVAGLYGAAARLVEALTVVPSMMGVALLPVASRHIFGGSETIRPLFRGTMKLALTLATAASLAFAAAAPVAVPFVFGDAFLGAVPALRVLALAVPTLFIRPAISRFLLALRRPTELVAIQVMALATTVAVAGALVPVAAQTGAAAAAVVGEVLGAAAGLWLVHRASPVWSFTILRPIGAGLPGAVVVAAALLLDPLFAAVVGLAAFFGAVRLFRVFEPAEVAYLEGAAPRIGPLTRLLLAPAG